MPVTRLGVMAAFGCNYQGDIAPAQVVRTFEDGFAIAAEAGARIEIELARRYDGLGDTAAHRARAVAKWRNRWPDKQLFAPARHARAWLWPTRMPDCAWA